MGSQHDTTPVALFHKPAEAEVLGLFMRTVQVSKKEPKGEGDEGRRVSQDETAGAYSLGRGSIQPDRVGATSGELQDRLVVQRVLAGERDRFRDVLKRHWGRVFRLTLRMVNDRQDAEDLTQQSFMEAFKDLRNYDQKRSFRTWLLRIATNNCHDYLKRQQRNEYPSGDSGEYAAAMFRSGAVSPEQKVATGRRVSQILRALDDLPPKYRIPLVLKDMEDLSYQEIEDVTDVPQATLRLQVHRARCQLRKALEEQDTAAGIRLHKVR